MIGTAAATLNETRKGLVILWDYKFSLLTQLLGIMMIVIGIMFFVGQGEITAEQVSMTLIGFIITFYAMETISTMSWALMTEAQAGTLEQMYMSPAPPQMIILGRSLASLVSGTIQMALVLFAMLLLFQQPLPLSLEAVPVILITMFGLLGFGYLIGGLTLVFKQVGPIANIMQNILLMVNGTFLPVALMPTWLGTLSMALPSTVGIILTRRVVLEGETLGMLWADGSLQFLLAHSLVTFVAGWVLYGICERIARRQGSLGQY